MNAFWFFARQMLRYRRLLAIALGAAVLDAACAFGGFAALLWVIDQLFGSGHTVRQLVIEKLSSPRLHWILPDPTAIANLVPAGKYAGFAFILGVIMLLTIFGSVMRFTYQLEAYTVTLRTMMRIRQMAFHRLVHAPLELLWAGGTADNLSRVMRDTAQLGRGFNALLGKAVRDILIGTAALAMALLINWKLTLLFLVTLPLVFVAIRKFGKRIRRASKRALRAYGWMVGALQESMQAGQVVKVHNAEGYERRRFNTINRKVFEQEMKSRIARAMSAPVTEVLSIAGVILVCLVAGWYVFRPGGGSGHELVNVLVMLGMAGASLKPLANLHNDLQEAGAAAQRLKEVLDFPVESNTRQAHKQRHHLPALPRHQCDIRFDNVSYLYPGTNERAVSQVDLHVRHGQTVAIVGPNGAGKTTLLSMLPRLIEPVTGRILIDGTDIAQTNLRSVRRQLAVVTQQTMLFEGTIADNIAYGRRHTPLAKIEQAAKAAHAHGFISELPQDYKTPLGESGAGLSGGQKQRLAIARAILRDPAILILDEATSQIDSESEAKINDALAALREGRTTFIIAHRLSTVVDADMIVVMVDGRIEDMGKHGELMRRCATYQVLTRTQLQGGELVASE